MFVRKSTFETTVGGLLVEIIELNLAVDELWESVSDLEAVVYGKAEVAAPKKAPAAKKAKPSEPISDVEKATPKRTTKKA